jgi:hypothetical protein
MLLIVLNGKEIIGYIEWLRFKIKIYFKQLENNDRNHSTNNRSRSLQG